MPERALSTTLPDEGASRYWNSVAEEWNQRPDGKAWRIVSDAVNIELLEKWLPRNPAGSVLKTDLFDEATGVGLLPWLSASFARVAGVDIAPVLVKTIRERHAKVQAEVADVRQLPFAAQSFDCIVSNSTLDHLPTRDDIGVAVRELNRVMRPGGHLLITLDNPVNPIVGFRNLLPERVRGGLLPYALGATLGPRGLRAMLEECGFDVLKSGAVFHSPRVLVVLGGRLVDRRTLPTKRRYAGLWRPFEALGALPTKYLTGHFVAMLARKR